MTSDRPIGQRFSHVYLRNAEPVSDSKRMRLRLARTLAANSSREFERTTERELGVTIDEMDTDEQTWVTFFNECELKDLLDTITLYFWYRYRHDNGTDFRYEFSNTWLKEVERIFREENSSYTVDKRGGVHFFTDREFEANRASSLLALAGPRYANAREAFERGYAALDHTPPDGKSAIRGIFHAAEGLFRLMFPKAGILGGDDITKHLLPALQSFHASGTAAGTAAQIMQRSFREWVAAAHQYRHEPGTEEPAQPDLSLAILMISQGASYIRWLADLDQARGAVVVTPSPPPQ